MSLRRSSVAAVVVVPDVPTVPAVVPAADVVGSVLAFVSMYYRPILLPRSLTRPFG